MSNENDSLATTRRALHGVAELVLAGPQRTACGSIRLRATPGGFGTVETPDLRVIGADLVVGDLREAIDGHTARSLARVAGVEATRLDEVYSGGLGVTEDEPLAVDEECARQLAEAFAAGDAALRAIAPDVVPILWPEHFDIAITVDEVNYGVSPGDDFLPVPYAYVGPWTVPAADDFWTQPFGAARELSALGDAAAVQEFFEAGRERLRR